MERGSKEGSEGGREGGNDDEKERDCRFEIYKMKCINHHCERKVKKLSV